MKHIAPVSIILNRPATAENLLIKERQVGLAGDIVALIAAAWDVANTVFTKED